MPTKKKPNPKKRRGPKTTPERSKELRERKKKFIAKYGEEGQPITPRSAILCAVVRELKRASEKKPLTKEALLDVCGNEFPKRKREGMSRYIGNLVPTRLRTERKLYVWKKRLEDGRMGYWIEGDGRTEQPVAAAAA